jgi:deazaflavin-dependent oxidoreductase (nitroreductase family)
MVPMFRLGFGPFFGNPFTGYIMVVKTIGRKTGRLRYVPLNYAIHRGNVYCLVGYGRTSPWFQNLQANPDIDVILPGGSIAGHVEEVDDASERAVVVRQILKNAGFAAVFEGLNPRRASDESIQARTADQPILRIRPTGIGNGPSDQGGWAWVWGPLLTVLAAIVILVVVR